MRSTMMQTDGDDRVWCLRVGTSILILLHLWSRRLHAVYECVLFCAENKQKHKFFLFSSI